MACTLVTSSAMAHNAGIGPKGLPRKSMSSPAMITLTPLLASWLHTSTSPSSRNCASSMPTTSMSDESSKMVPEVSTGVLTMELRSWLTTSSSEYLVSIAGLKISTRCLANTARLTRRMSSSVFPENIDPHTTSILPGRCSSPIALSVMVIAKLRRLCELTNDRVQNVTKM